MYITRNSLILLFITTGFLFSCSSGDNAQIDSSFSKVTIGLDNFYNHELTPAGLPYHYTWSDTAMTGFSQLGSLAVELGADTVMVTGMPTPEILAGLDVYIIVDPDTPQETPQPNYIDEPAISAIADWVNDGGILVLMANNTGNCEFEHFNMLAVRFGITFNGDSLNDSTPDSLHLSTLKNFPSHLLFAGIDSLFIKGISSLAVEPPAEAIYSKDGEVIMAVAETGAGMVYAIGDPWLYNEYIDIGGWNNLQAARNLLGWLTASAVK